MESRNIILKVFKDLYTVLTDILYGTDPKWRTLDDLIAMIVEAVLCFARNLTEQYAGELSDEVYRNRSRVLPDLRTKQRGLKKTIVTEIGVLELPKDLYVDRESRKSVAPVLAALGIRPHQKVTDGVKTACVEAAAEMSYAKAAAIVTDGLLTRRTIGNYVKQCPDVALFEVPATKRVAEILHIYMDEDHIALQHTPKKKHTIVPFAVVAEGLRKEGKDGTGRNRLINPAYFVSRDLSTKAVAAESAGYIAATYDLSALKHIYVHGDAGSWIRKALEDEIGAEHVLDGFHLTRELNRFARRFPDSEKQIQKTLKAALKRDDWEAFDAEAAAWEAKAADESQKKKCGQFRTFMKNNWKAAVLRQDTNIIGSCTEPQVQHLCSCRISSLPMSWSLEGVGSLMMLRAARANGVDIRRPKKAEQQTGGYARLLEEERQAGIGGRHDWSVFEYEHWSFNQDSGTQHLIKLIRLGGHRECA